MDATFNASLEIYDFDTKLERRGSNSVKWDLLKEEGVIPMWVADMDFKTAPFIIEALRKRTEHGIFGYTHVPDAYHEKVINWFAITAARCSRAACCVKETATSLTLMTLN